MLAPGLAPRVAAERAGAALATWAPLPLLAAAQQRRMPGAATACPT